jgi:hypothetical protein
VVKVEMGGEHPLSHFELVAVVAEAVFASCLYLFII